MTSSDHNQDDHVAEYVTRLIQQAIPAARRSNAQLLVYFLEMALEESYQADDLVRQKRKLSTQPARNQ